MNCLADKMVLHHPQAIPLGEFLFINDVFSAEKKVDCAVPYFWDAPLKSRGRASFTSRYNWIWYEYLYVI